jgi:hypothetical protein
MPPKKEKVAKKNERNSEEEDLNSLQIDIQYNPDIVASLLNDLAMQVDAKCNQIQKDSDFMVTSIRQAFNLELIRLPTQVKTMSLKKFKQEFGESLEAVARGTISNSINNKASSKILQTPSHRGAIVPQTPSTVARRNPREGEEILSANGSPLGEFITVKKAPKPDTVAAIVPPTPGVFVPLNSGELLNIDSLDIENMTQENKEDALTKMKQVMENMQSLMAKLSQPISR